MYVGGYNFNINKRTLFDGALDNCILGYIC